MNRTSIIIPVHNSLEQLEKCIGSIRLFTQEPYEFCIVDRGSGMEVSTFLRAQKIHFLSYSRKVGYAAACHAGLRMARGNTIALIHPEVAVSPSWLTGLLQVLADKEEVESTSPSLAEKLLFEAPAVAGNSDVYMGADQQDPEESTSALNFCFLFRETIRNKLHDLEGDTPAQVWDYLEQQIRNKQIIHEVSEASFVRRQQPELRGGDLDD